MAVVGVMICVGASSGEPGRVTHRVHKDIFCYGERDVHESGL